MLQALTDWLATFWTSATLAVGLLMIWQAKIDDDIPWHKIRTWLALLSVSAIEWLLTPSTGHTPFVTYIICDAIAAIVIIISPANIWQRAVAIFFVPMILAHFGVYWSERPIGGENYISVNEFAGWCQFAILLGWSGLDVGKAIRRRAHVRVTSGNHTPDIGAAR